MAMPEKVRAGRNRTLTVSGAEIPSLEKGILSADDIRESFVDNSIINADLFDCIDQNGTLMSSQKFEGWVVRKLPTAVSSQSFGRPSTL